MAGYDFLQPIFDFPGKLAKDAKRWVLELRNTLVMQNRILWLICTTQQPIPVSKFGATIAGDKIGTTDNYILLFENTSVNPVGTRVLAVFGSPPGVQVKLSLTSQKDDSGLVDFLGNTASGPSFNKRLSDTLVLPPKGQLWINTADTTMALGSSDIFRVRVFDPGEIITSPDWELRAQL